MILGSLRAARFIETVAAYIHATHQPRTLKMLVMARGGCANMISARHSRKRSRSSGAKKKARERAERTFWREMEVETSEAPRMKLRKVSLTVRIYV